jgi:type IV pilus assembly protein PilO
MPDLQETRRKLKIGIAALALLDVAAVALLISPLIGSEQSRRDHLQDLWREQQQKTREVEPLAGLDKKIPAARQEIDDFYKQRLTGQVSDISSDLGKLAQESGVKITGVKYTQPTETSGAEKESGAIDPAKIGLRRVVIEAGFDGNYVQLMRFINGLERNHLFFLVDSVELGGQESGTVQLKMKLETYLKTGTA